MNQVTKTFLGKDRRRGSAVVEAALLMPWICFLFVGILDSGFYTYGAMATQNAARAVAIQSANCGGTLLDERLPGREERDGLSGQRGG